MPMTYVEHDRNPPAEFCFDPICGADQHHRFVASAVQADRDGLNASRSPCAGCERDTPVLAFVERDQKAIRCVAAGRKTDEKVHPAVKEVRSRALEYPSD